MIDLHNLWRYFLLILAVLTTGLYVRAETQRSRLAAVASTAVSNTASCIAQMHSSASLLGAAAEALEEFE